MSEFSASDKNVLALIKQITAAFEKLGAAVSKGK